MRKIILALLVIALLALPTALAGDEIAGEVAVGVQRSNISDSANRAAEFASERDGFALSTWWDFSMESGELLQLNFATLSSVDQEGYLHYNNGHSWTIEAALRRFDHHLPHDSLANLEATDHHGKVVYATDEALGARFGVSVRESEATLKYRPEDSRAWEVALRAHRLSRLGSKQHTSTSHCANCHIVGKSRQIDQTIDTVRFSASYEKPSYGLRYEATLRDFNDNANALSRYYQVAKHPARAIGGSVPWDLFANRVQFDDTTLPVSNITENKTLVQTFRAFFGKGSDHLDGAIAFAESKASKTGLRTRHRSARVRWLHDFGDGLALALHGRYVKRSSDNTFVKVFDDNFATQGPAAGRRYVDIYTDSPNDFLRKSTYDRKTSSAKADLTWRYGAKRRHRVKGSLIAKQIDRDNFLDTETTEYRLRALFSGRFGEKTHYRFSGEYLAADNPFANISGAFRKPRTAGHTPSGNPFSDLQYFQMYRSRIADVTNQPTSGFQAKAYLTVTKSENAAFTFSGKYVDQKNDETKVIDWEKTAWNVGGSFWWAPSARVFATASYNISKDDVWTGVTVPVFDG